MKSSNKSQHFFVSVRFRILFLYVSGCERCCLFCGFHQTCMSLRSWMVCANMLRAGNAALQLPARTVYCLTDWSGLMCWRGVKIECKLQQVRKMCKPRSPAGPLRSTHFPNCVRFVIYFCLSLSCTATQRGPSSAAAAASAARKGRESAA